jgi:hypothetical protein
LIAESELVCLPFTSDLTEAGISYACRSLPHTYDRMGGSPFDRLRRIVVGIAVELAFRRYLTQEQAPFDVMGATPFTEPDRYDVSLGGRRCDIKSFLISYREQIAATHAQPGQVLKAPALIPLDQYAGDSHSLNDLYLFAFVTGLVAASPVDLQKALDAGKASYLVHALPPAWVRPSIWRPLGPLVLKSEYGEALTVEIGGQDAGREFVTRRLQLSPRTRTEVDGDFHSVAYVHVDARPEGRLGLHSPARAETHLIQPVDWGNIWVYGMRIYLAGWVTRDEFRRRASLLREGSRVFQYDRTRTKNLAMPVADLHPLRELLAHVRAWAGLHSNAAG